MKFSLEGREKKGISSRTFLRVLKIGTYFIEIFPEKMFKCRKGALDLPNVF